MLTGAGPEEVVIEAPNAGAMLYLQKDKNVDTRFSDLSLMLHPAVWQRQADRNRQFFSSMSRYELLNKVTGLTG